MKPVVKILKYFLVWRILLFIPVILGGYLLGYGTSHPFFEITYYKVLPELLTSQIFTAWSNFDGVHYLNIVSDGYRTEARFFPLLSIIIFVFSLGNISYPFTYISALIVTNAIFALALIMFYKLLRLDYSDKISFQTIIYLLVFPTAFFFAAVYTEGLFLLLTVSTFYFVRRKNWLAASLTGMLLVLTRFVGIFIIPVLIYEYFITRKALLIAGKILRLKDHLIVLAMSLFVSSGLIIYSIFNYIKWGSFGYFLSAHSELDNGRTASSLVFPLQTLYRYFKILTSLPISQFEWWIALLEVMAFTLGIVLLLIAWKKKVRVSYLIFGFLAFLLPALSGTFSGLPRYLLVIFPIFIALSLIESKFLKVFYYAISGILLFVLLMYFSKGFYIA